MSTIQEIEAAIPRLTRREVEQLRAWIDDFLEDQLELADDVKAKLDQSRREIAEGRYSTLALSSQLGAWRGADDINTRARRGNLADFDRIMAHARNVPPAPGDELPVP